jgi:hypothetical protein
MLEHEKFKYLKIIKKEALRANNFLKRAIGPLYKKQKKKHILQKPIKLTNGNSKAR